MWPLKRPSASVTFILNSLGGHRRIFFFCMDFLTCVGASNRTHIPVMTPTHCTSEYCNRKGFFLSCAREHPGLAWFTPPPPHPLQLVGLGRFSAQVFGNLKLFSWDELGMVFLGARGIKN